MHVPDALFKITYLNEMNFVNDKQSPIVSIAFYTLATDICFTDLHLSPHCRVESCDASMKNLPLRKLLKCVQNE